eukprot:929235_1
MDVIIKNIPNEPIDIDTTKDEPGSQFTTNEWLSICRHIKLKISNKYKSKLGICSKLSAHLVAKGKNVVWLKKQIIEYNEQFIIKQKKLNESLQSDHPDPFNNSKKVTRTPPKNRSIRAPIHSYHNYNAGLKETRNQPKRAQSMYLAPILSSQDTHNQHDSEDDAILPNETRDTFSITRDSYAVDNTITLDNTFTLDHREQMIVLSAYPMATSCGYVPRFSIKELQNALNKLEHNKLLTTNTNNQVFAASEIIVRDLADCGRLIVPKLYICTHENKRGILCGKLIVNGNLITHEGVRHKCINNEGGTTIQANANIIHPRKKNCNCHSNGGELGRPCLMRFPSSINTDAISQMDMKKAITICVFKGWFCKPCTLNDTMESFRTLIKTPNQAIKQPNNMEEHVMKVRRYLKALDTKWP